MNRQALLNRVLKELAEENLAIFAGAGMSAACGHVNWKELLRTTAQELDLDVDKEHDLVAIAQYHCNANAGNRSELNRRLIEEFSEDATVSDNHRILCRLPISTFWTTNYDKIIESALKDSGKLPDVKYTKEHLTVTKPKQKAVVYKMHGDIDHPNNAVLTKDDYERYHIKMEQFLSNLKGDLISKTFLFIGFSFTDPNLDYILSRVRIAYGNHQRAHYCFIKKQNRQDHNSDEDFRYAEIKQQHFISDLERFNIKTILIAAYSEITDFLKQLENKYKQKTIFISGAAHEYGDYEERSSLEFIHQLSSDLVTKDHKIVTGFGLGIGSAVISGALERTFMKGNSSMEQLIFRPFPQATHRDEDLKKLWTQYREDMIAHAGIAIFVFGNKLKDGNVVISNGMLEEYKIAKRLGLIIIPIAATGYASRKIWEEEIQYLRKNDPFGIATNLDNLANPNASFKDLEQSLSKLLTKLK